VYFFPGPLPRSEQAIRFFFHRFTTKTVTRRRRVVILVRTIGWLPRLDRGRTESASWNRKLSGRTAATWRLAPSYTTYRHPYGTLRQLRSWCPWIGTINWPPHRAYRVWRGWAYRPNTVVELLERNGRRRLRPDPESSWWTTSTGYQYLRTFSEGLSASLVSLPPVPNTRSGRFGRHPQRSSHDHRVSARQLQLAGSRPPGVTVMTPPVPH